MKYIFMVISLFFSFCSLSAQINGDVFFFSSDGPNIGVVVDNKVLFYKNNGNDWQKDPEISDFTIPDGSKGLVVVERNIGVVKDNTICFFYHNDASWKRSPQLGFSSLEDFSLPDNYEYVFGIIGNNSNYDSVIGVVVRNNVQFYCFHGTTWQKDPKYADFTLPKGYVDLSGHIEMIPHDMTGKIEPTYSLSIDVVVGGKRLGYYFDGRWRREEYGTFYLPKEYRGIFVTSYGTIGVIVNDKVQFYEYRHPEWRLATGIRELALPHVPAFMQNGIRPLVGTWVLTEGDLYIDGFHLEITITITPEGTFEYEEFKRIRPLDSYLTYKGSVMITKTAILFSPTWMRKTVEDSWEQTLNDDERAERQFWRRFRIEGHTLILDGDIYTKQ